MATFSRFARQTSLLLVAGLMMPLAMAEKPEWAGGGKGANKHGEKHSERYDDRRDDDRRDYDRRGERDDGGLQAQIRLGGIDIRIGDRERDVFRSYYQEQSRAGHCPPGLAKKNNGCLPPGQARKWARGKALPRDVVMYDIPRELSVRLPMPPAGHKYVRVAADVLLIAVGTNMVVDAVEDLLR